MTGRIEGWNELVTRAWELAASGWSEDLLSVGGASARKNRKIADVVRLLKQVDSGMPLERRPKDDVHERLRLDFSSMANRVYLVVENALGRRETVTTFMCVLGATSQIEGWCSSRALSSFQDTPWDRARLERRVVDYQWSPSLIDPGVNLVIDFVIEAGCDTQHSCEGHPNGGYLTFDGSGMEAVASVFRASGWRVEPWDERCVVRMPEVANVHERDDRWRHVCDQLEARFGASPVHLRAGRG